VKLISILGLSLLVSAAGCKRDGKETAGETDRVKITIPSGILINGKPATVEGLAAECRRLGQAHGTMRVFREGPPVGAAARAVALIKASGVEVKWVRTEAELK
jgi:hypothetical protein